MRAYIVFDYSSFQTLKYKKDHKVKWLQFLSTLVEFDPGFFVESKINRFELWTKYA